MKATIAYLDYIENMALGILEPDPHIPHSPST